MNKKILYFLILSAVVISVFPVSVGAEQQISAMVDGIKNVAVAIGMAIVVIGWVIAGILYLTSAGDPGKTGIAKKAMIAAIIGTFLVILAQSGYDTLKAILGNVFEGK